MYNIFLLKQKIEKLDELNNHIFGYDYSFIFLKETDIIKICEHDKKDLINYVTTDEMAASKLMQDISYVSNNIEDILIFNEELYFKAHKFKIEDKTRKNKIGNFITRVIPYSEWVSLGKPEYKELIKPSIIFSSNSFIEITKDEALEILND